MNPYHPLQGRAASQKPESQTKLRFGRKFVLCCWFFSLTAGFNHFCVQLLCGMSNKQRKEFPLETPASILFSSTWKTSFKCIPCWQRREVIFYTASPPPYGRTWSLLDTRKQHHKNTAFCKIVWSIPLSAANSTRQISDRSAFRILLW